MARSRQAAGRRSDYEWGGSCGLFNTIAELNQILTIASLNGSGTVVRLRGHVSVQIDGPADGDKKCVAMGLILATDAATAIGGTALPSPITDLDAEWIWHGFFGLQAQSATQSASEGSQVVTREIDSKAMRKFKSNSNVIAVVDGSNLSGTPVADAVVGVRVLIAQ